MNKIFLKIFAILVFVVIGFHFFHSEFDLFSCEPTSEHHDSHDYCRLMDSVLPSKGCIQTANHSILDFHPGSLLQLSEITYKEPVNEHISEILIPEDCPQYILNRIILI